MSIAKERIIGAITVMNEEEANELWELIKAKYAKNWDEIEIEEPDEWDRQMIKSVENNVDCQEFIPKEQVYDHLGLNNN